MYWSFDKIHVENMLINDICKSTIKVVLFNAKWGDDIFIYTYKHWLNVGRRDFISLLNWPINCSMHGRNSPALSSQWCNDVGDWHGSDFVTKTTLWPQPTEVGHKFTRDMLLCQTADPFYSRKRLIAALYVSVNSECHDLRTSIPTTTELEWLYDLEVLKYNY